MTTNAARISSPRLVRTIHRAAWASQARPVTSVEKQARRAKSNRSAIRRQCSRISGAWAYFSLGR